MSTQSTPGVQTYSFDESHSRLDAIGVYSHAASGIYPLGRVPAHATWGQGANAKYLCVDGKRTFIWAVGSLCRMKTDLGGPEGSSVCASIRLLRQTDRERMETLRRRTMPKTRKCSSAEACPDEMLIDFAGLRDLEGPAGQLTAEVRFPSDSLVCRIHC